MSDSDPAADLDGLRQAIASGDPAARLRAMGCLRPYPAEDCEPLLLACLEDTTVLVRSMACSGLGYKPTAAGTRALRRMLDDEPDPNVRAEAANALARHGGEQASEPLLALYRRDAHWLVRRSIVAALADERDVPAGVLAELADLALADDDVHLQLGGVELLNRLRHDPDRGAAARARLADLRGSDDHRLAAAALESLLPQDPC
jgi:HEAT repeat protein